MKAKVEEYDCPKCQKRYLRPADLRIYVCPKCSGLLQQGAALRRGPEAATEGAAAE
ncbi:MAG: hypothetical protein HY871_01555 [Chloroflexi bacterium]|nr:hypothetical protein [Chloroflexota bacterium]